MEEKKRLVKSYATLSLLLAIPYRCQLIYDITQNHISSRQQIQTYCYRNVKYRTNPRLVTLRYVQWQLLSGGGTPYSSLPPHATLRGQTHGHRLADCCLLIHPNEKDREKIGRQNQCCDFSYVREKLFKKMCKAVSLHLLINLQDKRFKDH